MSRSRTFVGVLWSSCQRFGTMILSFISNLVLARILTPKDFGTVGMLLFFISISNVFIDGGFGAALIQKKETTNKDYSSIFILNIIISLFLYLILIFVAPFISDFYNTPILTSLLRVEGLVLIGNALCMVQTAILRKEMNFKKLAIANLTGNGVGSILAISAAIAGFGVWSLVIRVISISFITSAWLWGMSVWKPSFVFDYKAVKGLFKFGGFLLLSTGLNTLASNMQTLIIGKLFQQRVLGIYTQAMTLRNVAADSLQSVIGQVLFPDYSLLQTDKEIEVKLNKAFYIISYYTIVLLVFLFEIAHPLIDFLYSTKWLAAVPYFKILCIGGIFYSIQDINYYVIAAKGKSSLLSRINICIIPIYICTLILTGKYIGIEGLLWSIVGYAFCCYMIYGICATKLIHSTITIQLKNLVKSLIICIVSACILNLSTKLLVIGSALGNMIVSFLIYGSSVVVISVLFKVKPFYYAIKMIRK